MGFQMPIVNSIVHIVKEELYYIGNTAEHIIMVNEILQQRDNSKEQEGLVEDLNKVYKRVEDSIPLLTDLENNALYGQRQPKFVVTLGRECYGLLQELSDISTQFLQILGQVEVLCDKDLYALFVKHITIEERYSLEVLSGYITQMASNGFGEASVMGGKM